MRRLSLIFATFAVVACGTKGPLTLPPKNLPPASKPAAQPAPAPNDASPADDSKPAAGAAR